MSIVFYFAPFSSASTVHWALEELKIPYEKVKLDLAAGDQRKPAFLAINPNGKVPALVHDGTPIFESVAILIHLGETFGVERGVFPEPGMKRAHALQWLVWAHVTVGEAAGRYLRNTTDRVPAEQRNAKTAEIAKAEIETGLAILDAALQGKTYLLGEKFSLADLHLAGLVGWIGHWGVDTSRLTALTEWHKRCTARPSFGAANSG